MTFPNGAASPRVSNRTLDRWFDTCTLLPSGATRGCLQGEQAVWTIQQPFTLRTWPLRLDTVRVGPIYNLDASVIKNNYIRERFNLIIRADRYRRICLGLFSLRCASSSDVDRGPSPNNCGAASLYGSQHQSATPTARRALTRSSATSTIMSS